MVYNLVQIYRADKVLSEKWVETYSKFNEGSVYEVYSSDAGRFSDEGFVGRFTVLDSDITGRWIWVVNTKDEAKSEVDIYMLLTTKDIIVKLYNKDGVLIETFIN